MTPKGWYRREIGKQWQPIWFHFSLFVTTTVPQSPHLKTSSVNQQHCSFLCSACMNGILRTWHFIMGREKKFQGKNEDFFGTQVEFLQTLIFYSKKSTQNSVSHFMGRHRKWCFFHCSPITRGPKNCKKGTHFDIKGDLKFDFFRIVHKERICCREIKLKFLQRWSIFTCRAG